MQTSQPPINPTSPTLKNKKIRCAIYTRKSTDEKLDMEFNTLDAQREAGEAYIRSQRHEGWEIISERYDDGGFSGGNADRPALKKLMEHLRLGYIDMIVVYKIDRLTRSLYDFAKMVELFDEHNVSFVSVTQQFNTSTSMGRLTLNVLLSFAQFEREISGERIRDKIEASKKKGMWMGGPPMLGYDVVDRKLIVNKEEAEIVNLAFERFIKTSSYIKTAQYLNQQGYKTKSWTSKNNIIHQGKDWSKQSIFKLLRKQVYIGLITHKGKCYQGEHQAIISQEIWDQAHLLMKKDVPERRESISENKTPLLKGLLECGCCNSTMVANHTKKDNKRYNYYTSLNAIKNSYIFCELGNIPATEIDNIVINRVKELLNNKKALEEIYNRLVQTSPKLDRATFFRKVKNIDKIWDFLCPAEIRNIITSIIQKVTIHKDKLTIEYKEEAILKFGDL